MLDLFRSEWLRYRKYALIFFTLFCALLGHMVYQQLFFVNSQIQHSIISIVCMFLGFCFGVVQIALHKRKSHWTYLVHRPLAPHQIFHALVGAAIMLLMIAVILPILLITFSVDILNAEIVEARHYLYSLHLSFILIFSYLVGIYLVLNPSWGAVATLGLLIFIHIKAPTAVTITFIVDIIGVVVAYYLARISFKVDLSTHLSKKRHLLVAAIAMQPALAFIIWLSQALYYHIPLIALDLHPDNLPAEAHIGYFSSTWHLTDEKLVALALEGKEHPNEANLIKQVALAKEGYINTQPSKTDVLGQLHFKDQSYGLHDKVNNTTWIYSHKHQVLIGKDNYQKKTIGVLTLDGFRIGELALNQLTESEKFNTIPLFHENKFIQTKESIYLVDFAEKHIALKYQLPVGEHFINELQFDPQTQVVIALTHQALYFFEMSSFEQFDTYIEPKLKVPHYRDFYDLRSISYYQLVDGYLLSYNASSFFGFQQSGLGLVKVTLDGNTELLGELAFKRYRPNAEFIDQLNYWQSPIFMGYIYDFIEGLYYPNEQNKYVTLDNIATRQYSQQTILYAILATIFSVLVTFIMSKRIQLSNDKILFWCLLNTVLAIPGLVAFLLLNRWRYLFKRIQQPSSADTLTPVITAAK